MGRDAEDEGEGFWKTRVGEETEDALCEALLLPAGRESGLEGSRRGAGWLRGVQGQRTSRMYRRLRDGKGGSGEKRAVAGSAPTGGVSRA